MTHQFTKLSPKARSILVLTTIVVLYVGLSSFLLVQHSDPIVDEPIYASSAFEFARSGAIRISNLSAPNAVFDTVWGGFFALLLGENYEALRTSTIALTAISGPFVYLLCRTLGGSSSLSVLGVAAYFFTPLTFSLSVTFQTDAHFLALTIMAVAVIAYGLTTRENQTQLLLTGSALVALAFLSRPQALVVAIAAVLVWLYPHPARPNRLAGVSALTALPTVSLVLHSIWTSVVGEPYIRLIYREHLLALNPKTYLALGSQTLVEGVTYLGFFALPFTPMLIPVARKMMADRKRIALALAVSLGTIAIGLSIAKMGPLNAQSWVTSTGLGAVDRSFLGHRPGMSPWLIAAVTGAFAASAYALILSLVHERPSRKSPGGMPLVTLTLLGFAAGALISTLGAHGRILDRYWLPLVPLVIALSVSASASTAKRLWIASSLLAVFGLVSVVGTADAFSTYRSANDFANTVIVEGIDPLSLEAGASWAATRFGLTDDDPAHLYRPGPFWLKFYSVESNPEYGIVLEPLEGYTVLERREYRSILHLGSNYLYLVHRDPGLPFYLGEDL